MNIAGKRRWSPQRLISHLKTNKPYKDLKFVKEMRKGVKLEDNFRVLGCDY